MRDYGRIVVKVGTSTLTYDNGKPNLRRMDRLCRVLTDLKNAGKEVVLVSSGAIAVGLNHLGLTGKSCDTPGKQAAAAVGQCDLMYTYDKLFSEYGQSVAQMLLTRDVVESGERRENCVNTFKALMKMDIIPVVNENDSVSVEEIVFGDNDKLSAIVAGLIGAELLIILTDIEGLFDGNPRENPEARLVHTVREITPEIRDMAGQRGSTRGTGGMITKLEAAEYAMNAGVDAYIIDGGDPKRIYDVIDGRSIGTHFIAKTDRGVQ